MRDPALDFASLTDDRTFGALVADEVEEFCVVAPDSLAVQACVRLRGGILDPYKVRLGYLVIVRTSDTSLEHARPTRWEFAGHIVSPTRTAAILSRAALQGTRPSSAA